MALLGAALVGVGLLPLSSAAQEISTQPSFLSKVGPVATFDGFPTYYQDSNGLRLSHCSDGSALCGGAESPLPDPTAPVSFPNNYPFESFYYLAQATVDLAGGNRGKFVASIEASFNSADPEAGAQMTFNRLRFVVDAPTTGTYTIIHPYGKDSFDVTAAGPHAIFATTDIGIASGIFTGALGGRVNPFLEWDTGPITDAAGNQFIGDPNTAHAVTGSPFGTNFFEIDGPNVGGTGINSVSTNLFTLVGELDTNAGLDPGHPTYSRTSTDSGFVDVHAASDPNKAIKAALPGSTFTSLRGSATGDYVARLPFSGAAPPTSVTVENLSDKPVVVTHPKVTDQVTVTDATYDADAQTLTVTAVSSDQATPPTLTAEGFGALAAGTQNLSGAVQNGATTGTTPALSGTVAVGTQVFANVAAPPETVVVTSSRGGNQVADVRDLGAAFAADPATADAGPDATVQQGQVVTLDGSLSINATSFSWTQTGGTAVTLANATTPVASFTAPATSGTLTFRLTVSNDTGTSIDDVAITVAAVTAPTANAGPDQTGVHVGDTVLLDASASSGGASFQWTQVSGSPIVTLTAANTSRASFTMPSTSNPLVFQVTVTGPGGSATDTVTIQAVLDKVTVTRVEYTQSSAQWRVDGTATILDNNNVNVYLGTSANGAFIGRGGVDPVAGTFDVRVKPSSVSPGSFSTVFVQSDKGGTAIALITLK